MPSSGLTSLWQSIGTRKWSRRSRRWAHPPSGVTGVVGEVGVGWQGVGGKVWVWGGVW